MAGVYLSEARNPVPPLPPYTLCTCILYAYPEVTLLRPYGDLPEMKLDYSITIEVKDLTKIANLQEFVVE